MQSRNPKNLFKRGETWWFRKKFKHFTKAICRSTGTSDKDIAVKFRNNFVQKFAMAISENQLAIAIVQYKGDAMEKAKVMISQFFPDLLSDVSPKITEAVKSFISQRVVNKRAKQSTLNYYKKDLEQFHSIIGDKLMSSVSVQDIQDYIRILRTSVRHNRKRPITEKDPAVKISDRTIFNKYCSIRTFFSWAHKSKTVRENVFTFCDPPRYKKVPTPPIPDHLIEQCLLIPYPSSAAISQRTWEIMPQFMRYTGGRLGEVATIMVEDFVYSDGIYCIDMNNYKNESITKKLIPIHPKLLPYVTVILNEVKTGMIFPDSGDIEIAKGDFNILDNNATDDEEGDAEHAYGRIFSKLYNKMIKSIAPKLRCHSWRSYVAKTLKNKGVPKEIVRDLLGHADSDGDVHDRYAGRALAPILYDAIQKIP